MIDIQPEVDETSMTDLFPYEECDDPRRNTHIVSPPENKHIYKRGMSAQDVVDIARATDQEVVALCGYRWVPKHNPEKYGVCDPCVKQAYQYIRENHL